MPFVVDNSVTMRWLLELALREGLALATLNEGLNKAANKAGIKRIMAGV